MNVIFQKWFGGVSPCLKVMSIKTQGWIEESWVSRIKGQGHCDPKERFLANFP